MKTKLVEIFQTIRASAQPYTAMGFASRTNSETSFELYTEKVLDESAPEDTLFFAGINIREAAVELCICPAEPTEELALSFRPRLQELRNGNCFEIKDIDKELLSAIEEALSEGYRTYKQKGWA